jgi:hypothetical protein
MRSHLAIFEMYRHLLDADATLRARLAHSARLAWDRIEAARDAGAPATTALARYGEHYVTLDQAAALVRRSKRTLERDLKKGAIPQPDIRGQAGRASKWAWSSLRPALSRLVEIELPSRFPGDQSLPPS